MYTNAQIYSIQVEEFIHVYSYVCMYVYMCAIYFGGGLIAKSCLTLCNPMDRSPPVSSSHGILGIARIPEWVAISSSRRSSRPRDWTRVSCLAGRFFTTKPLGEPFYILYFTCSEIRISIMWINIIIKLVWGISATKPV